MRRIIQSCRSTNRWMSPIENASTQKFGESATIPGPMTTTSARTSRGSRRGCVLKASECLTIAMAMSAYLYFILWTVNVLIWLVKRKLRTKGWTGVRSRLRDWDGSGGEDRDGLSSWEQEP